MRMLGVDIPGNKIGEVSLSYIYGIGRSLAKKILKEAGVDKNKKLNEMSLEEINAITELLKQHATGGALKAKVKMDIKRMMDIGCLRGIRHKQGLPVRGQRTKSNARTRKGKRKTVANKKIEKK